MKCAYGLQVCSCTSVITPLGLFNVSSTFFFYTRYLSALVGSEINAAVFQFFQLTLRRFVIVYCLGDSRATDQ